MSPAGALRAEGASATPDTALGVWAREAAAAARCPAQCGTKVQQKTFCAASVQPGVRPAGPALR